MRGFCRVCHLRARNPNALLCERHRKESRRESWRRYNAGKRGKARKERQQKIEELFPEIAKERKEARKAKRRVREQTPAGKAKKKAAWRRYAVKVRKPKKVDKLKEFWAWAGRRRRKKWQNARPEAREKRREYMRRYHTKYLGTGKKPKCVECGAEVLWAGRGMPRRKCEECRG